MKNKKKIILSSSLSIIGLSTTVGVSIMCSSCSIVYPIKQIDNDYFKIWEYSDGTFWLIEPLDTKLTQYNIPNNINVIYSNAFWYCRSLRQITIPDSVNSIGEYAFAYCSLLTSITLPNGINSIANRTFLECESLKSIIIPNSVNSIGDSAFSDCNSLTSITIPDNIKSIGKNAFSLYNGTYTPLPNLTITVPNETIKQLVINSGFNDESRIIVQNNI
ncbi:MAG: leucine-rich repeat domain-containing protein [Ureaplasma sp.]|nr:leucine-rich repeat domain-containing protein [Ureaplasma sp.]MDE6289547.1 leucine-rich repeat domain-containing protein [Ureaplasma sp.]